MRTTLEEFSCRCWSACFGARAGDTYYVERLPIKGLASIVPKIGLKFFGGLSWLKTRFLGGLEYFFDLGGSKTCTLLRKWLTARGWSGRLIQEDGNVSPHIRFMDLAKALVVFPRDPARRAGGIENESQLLI